jgi:hypothetical protein
VVKAGILFDHLPLVVPLLIVEVLLLAPELLHLFAKHIPPGAGPAAHDLLKVGAGDVLSRHHVRLHEQHNLSSGAFVDQ